ncbi:cytochrome P450 CYP736A12-like [Pyrus ussuriensis x Pyrus communis]|uniref:Cytochrome P450 CYP736A12-like n=1 Tax=Pyrus ussuriensis x Pyrus communis TaxID=2448454 RepID=A0A5N5FXS1_9ROSA|nr:cytochrome P450 CYP736A12-like [Pyrus ussuriensis x Pyrus communis]
MAFWIWLTIGVLVLVRIVQACISKGKNKNKMLPPGPRGFPIFGSLHLLGKFPTMDLHQLAQKYGDIMYLRLGLQHTVVVSSARAAELFLKTHDHNFVSRPPTEGLVARDHMTCRMVFGKKYKDEEFGGRGFASVMKEGMKLAAAPNLGDFIHCIAPLDLQGLTKKMKAVNKAFDEFFGKVIDEHLQYKDKERTRDFIDALLAHMGSEGSDYRIERLNIKAMMSDMFAASADTSSTTVQWALSELLRHPQDMKKVQKELENVVGLKRMVEESDMEKLEYLDMVVKETMRLHPVVPLLLPHAAIKDCTADGYHIPKKSRIIINAWAIGRDPSAWVDAEKEVRTRKLGITVVHFVLAQLVHCFDWELPDNMLPNELDMTEEFGLLVSRAKNLLAIPSYRLQN